MLIVSRRGERGKVGRGDELCVCQIIKLQGIMRKDFLYSVLKGTVVLRRFLDQYILFSRQI
jgi:hypothetical protein